MDFRTSFRSKQQWCGFRVITPPMLKEKRKHELNFTQIDVSFLIFSRCRQWFMKRSTLSLCGSFLQCSLMPGSLYVPVQLLDCSLFSSKRLCLTSGGSQEYIISCVTQKLIIICLCSGKTRHFFSWYAADWDFRLQSLTVSRGAKDAEVDGVCWRCGSHIGGCVPVCLCRFPQRQNQSFRAMLRPSP